MALKANFNRSDVERRFSAFLAKIEKREIDRMQYLGEMCVKHARTIPASSGFTDQTGNLRSSIGYTIFKNGIAIHEGYKLVLKGSEGIRKAKALAEKVGAGYPKGILLVVTAGMDYAAALEAGGAWGLKSKRGHDVLASAELLAERELPILLKKLRDNINKATAV